MESSRKVHIIAVAIFAAASIWFLLVSSYGLATVDGVYHRVRKGETVWQISRAYRVDRETIRKANRLPSSMRIRAGAYLFIPKAEKAIRIEPQDWMIRRILKYVTSKRWKYIVVHHSATEKGSARVFDRNHRTERHFRHGLGYHFVICNGTYGKKDGQIEISRRWYKQLNGAHCRAGDGNKLGIGICVVGNFNNTRPSRKQFDSLVHLVTHLCYEYDIPIKNVRGHGEMPGASTECPGKNFPMLKFKKALQERGCR